MLLLSGALRGPARPPEGLTARKFRRHGFLPHLQPRRRPCRLQTRPRARCDAAEAVAAGDGGAAVAAERAAPAEASGGGWRSWLPFSWVTSSGSGGSSSGDGAPKSTVASSEPALALLDSDGMAAALALVPSGVTAPQPAQLSPALEAELDAVAQQALQRQERKAAVPGEGPTVLVRGAAAAPATAESAAQAAAEQHGESPLLLPGGIPLHHPVLELLRQRKWEGSAPGARNDPYKIGEPPSGGCSAAPLLERHGVIAAPPLCLSVRGAVAVPLLCLLRAADQSASPLRAPLGKRSLSEDPRTCRPPDLLPALSHCRSGAGRRRHAGRGQRRRTAGGLSHRPVCLFAVALQGTAHVLGTACKPGQRSQFVGRPLASRTWWLLHPACRCSTSWACSLPHSTEPHSYCYCLVT